MGVSISDGNDCFYVVKIGIILFFFYGYEFLNFFLMNKNSGWIVIFVIGYLYIILLFWVIRMIFIYVIEKIKVCD